MPRAILKSVSRKKLDAQVVNRPTPSCAISSGESAALFAPFNKFFGDRKAMAIAVSGGADSMALCLLADEWARAKGHQIIAITVDHGLRVGTKEEGLKIANWLSDRGVAHHILTWQGTKPMTGIQAAARNARYKLLVNWCTDNNITGFMTAHHLEDQVETFLLRAERGSGLNGLASMNTLTNINGVVLMRPLLRITKSRLYASLTQRGQSWVEDPSNQNPAYRRTKMRKLVVELETQGLTPQKISDLISHFAGLRRKFADVVAVFFDRAVRVLPVGYGVVHLDILQRLPDPILERVLVHLTSILGGKKYPPRRDRLKRAMKNIKSDRILGFTLGGCRFIVKGHSIMICRDQRAISTQKVCVGSALNWDGLFFIEISGVAGMTANLSALGKKGWLEIVHKSPELKRNSIPYEVRVTLPSLIDAQGVVEVPGLGYRRDGKAKLNLTVSKLQYGMFSL
jgi:tRNA(Ile)-lysidine synthase